MKEDDVDPKTGHMNAEKPTADVFEQREARATRSITLLRSKGSRSSALGMRSERGFGIIFAYDSDLPNMIVVLNKGFLFSERAMLAR